MKILSQNLLKENILNIVRDEMDDLLPTDHVDDEYNWSGIIANKFVKELTRVW